MFITGSLLIYIPVINNNFAADDFQVVHRVAIQGKIFVNGFFRPLSDITLYVNYWLDSLNPASFRITNILVHACCSFLVYHLARRLGGYVFTIHNVNLFSWVSAVLFLTYPFHNESVVWVVGRASILAAFFGLACLLVVVSDINSYAKRILAGLFYLIGLFAYESIFFIPLMVMILQYKQKSSYRTWLSWLFVFTIALVIHFMLRIQYSGGIAGNYGEIVWNPDPFRYVNNLMKILGRMFLPPMDSSTTLTILFSIIMIVYITNKLIRKYSRGKPIFSKIEVGIILLLFVSLIIPVSFAISTRTSEGDRLLYFPSLFFCMLIGYLIVEKIRKKNLRNLVFLACIVYNIVFLQINNFNWRTASSHTNSILSQVTKLRDSAGPRMLINLPGEYKGAYIFRNGFEEALLLRNIDTSAWKIINITNHAAFISTGAAIEPEYRNDTVYFGRSVLLFNDTLKAVDLSMESRPEKLTKFSNREQIWYWNNTKLKRFF
jgi:hypothetical protein